jgi:hypothetical protein
LSAKGRNRRSSMQTRLAQDIPTAWGTAMPDQRRRIVWSVFETIRIGDGRVVSARPKPMTAPLLALTGSILRSRPGSEPQYRTFAGVVIEGIEDLAQIADGVA